MKTRGINNTLIGSILHPPKNGSTSKKRIYQYYFYNMCIKLYKYIYTSKYYKSIYILFMIILSLFGSLPLQEICCKTLQDMGQGLKAVQAPRPIYIYIRSSWWLQPLWKILVNGKDYPIYYGKLKMFETTNHIYIYMIVYDAFFINQRLTNNSIFDILISMGYISSIINLC